MKKDSLSKTQLEIISEAVLKEHHKLIKKEHESEKDWRLRNTKLLLKHYQMLQKHCEEITEDLDDYEEIVFDPAELDLKALMKYKAKTKKMLDYFDASFGSYRDFCKGKGYASIRRCNVLYKLYISTENFNKVKIAEFYSLDEKTIRRDEAKATEELSIFLFGIDSLADLEGLVL